MPVNPDLFAVYASGDCAQRSRVCVLVCSAGAGTQGPGVVLQFCTFVSNLKEVIRYFNVLLLSRAPGLLAALCRSFVVRWINGSADV